MWKIHFKQWLVKSVKVFLKENIIKESIKKIVFIKGFFIMDIFILVQGWQFCSAGVLTHSTDKKHWSQALFIKFAKYLANCFKVDFLKLSSTRKYPSVRQVRDKKVGSKWGDTKLFRTCGLFSENKAIFSEREKSTIFMQISMFHEMRNVSSQYRIRLNALQIQSGFTEYMLWHFHQNNFFEYSLID